jgi:hypothetical protein
LAFSRLTKRIFDALQINFDCVADLEFRSLAADREFLERDAPFHLHADVDDGEVFFNGNDLAFDDTAFIRIFFFEALGQKGREIVAGRVQFLGGVGHSHAKSSLRNGLRGHDQVIAPLGLKRPCH